MTKDEARRMLAELNSGTPVRLAVKTSEGYLISAIGKKLEEKISTGLKNQLTKFLEEELPDANDSN